MFWSYLEKKQFAYRLSGTSVTEFSLSLCCYSFLGALWHLFQRLIWKSSKGNILPIISFLWGIFFLTLLFFSPPSYSQIIQTWTHLLRYFHTARESNHQPGVLAALIKNYLWKTVCQKLRGKYAPENIWWSTTKASVSVWMEGALPINAANSVKLWSLAGAKMPKWGGGRERRRETPWDLAFSVGSSRGCARMLLVWGLHRNVLSPYLCWLYFPSSEFIFIHAALYSGDTFLSFDAFGGANPCPAVPPHPRFSLR